MMTSDPSDRGDVLRMNLGRNATLERAQYRAFVTSKQDEWRLARAATIEQALRQAFSEAPDLFAGLDPAALAGPVTALIADIEAGRA